MNIENMTQDDFDKIMNPENKLFPEFKDDHFAKLHEMFDLVCTSFKEGDRVEFRPNKNRKIGFWCQYCPPSLKHLLKEYKIGEL
jgi:hypothetical protein